MGRRIQTDGASSRLDADGTAERHGTAGQHGTAGRRGSAATLQRYAELTPSCHRSLADSYDRQRNLFAHQLLDGRWVEVDHVYPHETLTSSCIALLGLARSGTSFVEAGVDPHACIDAVAGEIRRTGYRGGVGLALWANAVVDGVRDAAGYLGTVGLTLDGLVRDLIPTFTTMETAWCASGLLHEARRTGDRATTVAAQRVVDELRTNRYSGATQLMRHAGPGATAVHRARGHIANFADQIYSLQAFAFASLVLDDAAALGAGSSLARRHASLQGDRGQWWWHYDASRGHVALRFAVYSVHQHGMAPMALAAIDDAGGGNFVANADASLAWIDHNESGRSMFDAERATIWRSLERVEPRLAGRARGALEALGVADDRPAEVELNRETRPYEWAWCLYAAAIATGVEPGRSLV